MKQSKYQELNDLIINWADQKGILSKATPLTQLEKTKEEVNELQEALFAKQNGLDQYINSKGELVNTDEEIKDGLGDSLVTLVIQSEMNNLDLLDCLESAYLVIRDRKGKMINGTFVKE